MSCNDWKKVNLSSVCEIIGGGTPKTTVQQYWKGDIPWLSIDDFNNDNRHVFYTQKSITEEGLKKSSTKLLNTRDIIISARGTVGVVAQLALPMAFNQSCYGIRAKQNITINDFLYYAIKNIVSQIKANTHGSVFDTITRNTFDNLNIQLPPMEEQYFISNTLSCLDDKIELNNRINKNLEEMAQAIFKRWFVDFEFPDENGNPYKSSGGEMVESELGEIPKEWKVGKLGNVANITSGSRPKTKTESETIDFSIPLVGASSIMGYVNSFLFDSPILVIGRVGTHGVIQRFCAPCWPSDNTLILKSKYYEFIYQILKNIDYKKLNRGSTQPLITQTDIKNTNIIIPSYDTAEKFEYLVGSLFKKANIIKTENKKLKNLSGAILPKLMSGEICMPCEEAV